MPTRPPRRQHQHHRSTAQRGYGARHQRDAKAAIAAQPWCSWCGATEDLCGDHIDNEHPELGYMVLCRSCNSKKRNGATGP